MALQANEGKQAVRSLVLGFAVRKAGEPAEPPPVRRARVGVVASGEGLRCEGAEKLWEDCRVLEPCLEVAGTGLDDGARSEAVGRELRERDLGEIVEGSVAMLTGRSEVDVRAADVAVLEAIRWRRVSALPITLRSISVDRSSQGVRQSGDQ